MVSKEYDKHDEILTQNALLEHLLGSLDEMSLIRDIWYLYETGIAALGKVQ